MSRKIQKKIELFVPETALSLYYGLWYDICYGRGGALPS